MTSSGSDVSANAVNPRRSRNTTVTSRRWVSSGSSAPPATISSASWGEKKRLSRPSRSSWPTCSATRCSSVRFHSASSRRGGGLLLVAQPLLLEAGADARAQQHGVEGLGQIVLGAQLDAADDAVHSRRARRSSARGCRAASGPPSCAREHLVAVEARHHHVEQHEVDRGAGAALERRQAAVPSAAVRTS